MTAREIMVQVALWAPVALVVVLVLMSLPNFFKRGDDQ